MNIDRTLNIYQAYSLAKISALNKQMVIAQCAQSEQIGKLEKSLSKELKAINEVNHQLLENQIKEAKRQERIRYYRNLAHNIKECIDIIDGQKDLVFKTFLLEIFQKPISLYLQDAKANLEEIGDKEFCSNWERILQNNVNQASSVRAQFCISPFNTLLEQHESYKNEEDALEKQFLNNKIEKLKIKAPVLEHAKSINSYQSKGCLLTTCIFAIFSCVMFLFGAIGNGFSDTSELISVIVFLVFFPLSIFGFFMVRASKKRKTYKYYLANVEKENNERIANYNDLIANADMVFANLQSQKKQLEQTHPYVQAKAYISNLIPEWDTIVDSITVRLTVDKSESGNAGFDPLLAKIAMFAVKHEKISISSIQRIFKLGYTRAGKIADQLVSLGVIVRNSSNVHNAYDVIVDDSALQLLLEYYHIE